MARIIIDGREFNADSVDIIGGRVTIDGVRLTDTVSGVVEIRVLEGVLGSLRTDASVNCGDVAEGVMAGGSVNCGGVGGSVQAAGSVNCGDVGGSVRAGGIVTRYG